MWCAPEIDAEYLSRMCDLRALYEKPLSKQESVVCLDERPVQLQGEKRKALRASPGNLVGTVTWRK